MRDFQVLSGGMPLFGNDFAFIQDGFKEALFGSIRRFVDENSGVAILNGLQVSLVSGSTYSISGGWVVMGGELLYFDGDNITVSGSLNLDTIYLEDYVFDYGSLTRLVAGTPFNPYKVRGARLKASGTSALNLNANNRLENIIQRMIVPATTVSTGFVASNGATLLDTPRLQKTGNLVFLTCKINLSSSATYNTAIPVEVGVLPSAFRPDRFIQMPCSDGGSQTLGVLGINNANGKIFYNTPAATNPSGQTLYITNLTFYSL